MKNHDFTGLKMIKRKSEVISSLLLSMFLTFLNNPHNHENRGSKLYLLPVPVQLQIFLLQFAGFLH